MLELRCEDGSVPWRLEVADSWLARLRGLIGRKGLAVDEGLYLPGTNSIHMLFMRFPIDCLFLGTPDEDGNQKVIAVREALAPWTGVVWWVRGAHGAVEVGAGSAAQAGVKPGNRVLLRRRAADSG